MTGASGADLKTRVEMIMIAPPSTPLSPPLKLLLLAAGVCALASPAAAGLPTSPTSDPSGAKTDASSPPSAQEIAGPAQPGAGAQTAVGQRGAAPTPGKPLTAVRHRPADFATDPTTDANCYVIFGELRCNRNAPHSARP